MTTLDQKRKLVPTRLRYLLFRGILVRPITDDPSGSMLHVVVRQFRQTSMGELDYLTSTCRPNRDVQLSLAHWPVQLAVLVTNPMKSHFLTFGERLKCRRSPSPSSSSRNVNFSALTWNVTTFRQGGGQKTGRRQRLNFLGECPWKEVREGGDKGIPVVVSAPDRAVYRIHASPKKSPVTSLSKR